MTVTVSCVISMGHRLPSYKGICASPHGHNVRFTVHLDTDEFTDFKEVQGTLQQVVEDMDHAMVLWDEDPVAEFLQATGFRVVKLNVEPTTENIAQYVFNALHRVYEHVLNKVEVQETDKYSATCYHRDEDVERVIP